MRRAEPVPGGDARRTKLLLRIGAGLPLGWVGNTVWRIKRRPVWNRLAAEGAAMVKSLNAKCDVV